MDAPTVRPIRMITTSIMGPLAVLLACGDSLKRERSASRLAASIRQGVGCAASDKKNAHRPRRRQQPAPHTDYKQKTSGYSI